LKHAYEDADRHNWTKVELEAYNYAEMRKQDDKGKTDIAIRKAVEDTVENNVVEFYKNGVSVEIISKSTKLAIAKVIEILKRNGLLSD